LVGGLDFVRIELGLRPIAEHSRLLLYLRQGKECIDSRNGRIHCIKNPFLWALLFVFQPLELKLQLFEFPLLLLDFGLEALSLGPKSFGTFAQEFFLAAALSSIVIASSFACISTGNIWPVMIPAVGLYRFPVNAWNMLLLMRAVKYRPKKIRWTVGPLGA
jgi:hypothetical protein